MNHLHFHGFPDAALSPHTFPLWEHVQTHTPQLLGQYQWHGQGPLLSLEQWPSWLGQPIVCRCRNSEIQVQFAVALVTHLQQLAVPHNVLLHRTIEEEYWMWIFPRRAQHENATTEMHIAIFEWCGVLNAKSPQQYTIATQASILHLVQDHVALREMDYTTLVENFQSQMQLAPSPWKSIGKESKATTHSNRN